MKNTARDIAQSIINDNCFVPGNPSYARRLPEIIETIHTHAMRQVMGLRDDEQSNLLPVGVRATSDTQRILLGAAMVVDEALDILGIGVGVNERPTLPGTQPLPRVDAASSSTAS